MMRNRLIPIITELLSLMRQLLARKKKGFQAFAKALRLRESGGNYRAVNTLGYLGAYQFGMPRLTDLGLAKKRGGGYVWKDGYSREDFLSNKQLQDKVFEEHVYDLAEKCQRMFCSYFDDEITLSGAVAGAHLGGLGGVRKFFEEEANLADAYGTKVGDYIREFSGYEL